MTLPGKLETIKNAGIATLFVIFTVYFSGLAEPWLAILCGIACAITLDQFDVRLRSFVFLLTIFTSFLESRSWFLGNNTIAFGCSGLLTTWTFYKIPQLSKTIPLVRMLKVLPTVLVIGTMPLTASLFSAKSPKRGMLDGGVWATVGQLPKGQDALSTKHQYTYEKFKDTLGAKVVLPSQPLDQFDELILITPTVPFDASSVKNIRNWTANGGRLLVVADHTNLFGHQTVLKELIAQFNISLQPDALYETETNGGIYENFFGKYAGLTPCTISSGVVPRLKMTGFSEQPDYTAPSFFGKMDPSNDDEWGHHVVMGSKRFGLGEVSVFSDSTFFANFAINRWSSQVIISAVFWNRTSAIVALLGLIALLIYLKKPAPWLLFSANSLILISPSIGFNLNAPSQSTTVALKPPDSVSNDSEERDKGTGSSLLASAYAFDVQIKWDPTAKNTFRSHLLNNGLALVGDVHVVEPKSWQEIPTFDIQQIISGKFYVDQNTFWYSQGAGLLRSANMVNCWESLGASIPESYSKIALIGEVQKSLRGDDGITIHKITSLNDNWVIFDNRVVGRWVPESAKWLIRKEWQFGPWLKKDLLYELVP